MTVLALLPVRAASFCKVVTWRFGWLDGEHAMVRIGDDRCIGNILQGFHCLSVSEGVALAVSETFSDSDASVLAELLIDNGALDVLCDLLL